MKNEHLYLIIGVVMLVALLGVIVLAAMGRAVPEALYFVITTGIGALAMAAKGTNNGDKENSSDGSRTA